MYLDFQTQWSTMYYYTSAYLNMSHLDYMCIPHMDFFPVILCNAYLCIKYVCAFPLINSSHIYQRNVKGGIKGLSIVVKLLAAAILFQTGLKPFLKKIKIKCMHIVFMHFQFLGGYMHSHPNASSFLLHFYFHWFGVWAKRESHDIWLHRVMYNS